MNKLTRILLWAAIPGLLVPGSLTFCLCSLLCETEDLACIDEVADGKPLQGDAQIDCSSCCDQEVPVDIGGGAAQSTLRSGDDCSCCVQFTGSQEEQDQPDLSSAGENDRPGHGCCHAVPGSFDVAAPLNSGSRFLPPPRGWPQQSRAVHAPSPLLI